MRRKPRKKCLNCEEYCKRFTTKFCSQKCANAYRSKHKIARGGPKASKEIKHCTWCDMPFYPYNKGMRFCSKTCSGKDRFHNRGDTLFMEKGHESARNMRPEQKAKLAEAMSRRNKERGYTKGVGGRREDIGHYVRSRWEANICRLLKHVGIRYQYEPDRFKLEEGDNRYIYTPDIKIAEKIYIEVKGWETEKAKIKKRLMPEQYPDIKIIYINEPKYKYLSKLCKDKIKNWEYDKNHGR